MANDTSTIQSLKAVDAWIDVINSNINGGVRTAFKSSRLKFGGSNINIGRAGNLTSLPLQFPETGLMTSNTVIDFSQGAITTSTENTHLAVQGEGFFLVCDPATMNTTTGKTISNASAKFYLTRDGEFRTNAQGLLVNSSGYFLVSVSTINNGTTGRRGLEYDAAGGNNAYGSSIRAVYNNLDMALPTVNQQDAVSLTDFLAQTITDDIGGSGTIAGAASTMNIALGKQSLMYSQFGSTVFDFGFKITPSAASGLDNASTSMSLQLGTTAMSSILNKSLEASNASMTQSVPELSLAQKLFSALTKVLQISQTNTDAVLNLIR
ncbi:MAG: hypothetical protein H7338_13630 [Candidatus Sericytochromatia bacterium]|nr:hypothetical protein [Candidatus Sericytochromatia bacterium]